MGARFATVIERDVPKSIAERWDYFRSPDGRLCRFSGSQQLLLMVRLPDKRFTRDALRLLKGAAEGDAEIHIRRVIGPTIFFAGGKLISESRDNRETIRWEAAIEELQKAAFVRDMNGERYLYVLTQAGLEFSDTLAPYEELSA